MVSFVLRAGSRCDRVSALALSSSGARIVPAGISTVCRRGETTTRGSRRKALPTGRLRSIARIGCDTWRDLVGRSAFESSLNPGSSGIVVRISRAYAPRAAAACAWEARGRAVLS